MGVCGVRGVSVSGSVRDGQERDEYKMVVMEGDQVKIVLREVNALGCIAALDMSRGMGTTPDGWSVG